MDTRRSAVRGGSWRRGGRGGSNSETAGGENRGRGRGGYHRGRGKRDHYRGRGRGGSGHSADFQHRDEGEDEGDDFQEEGDRKVFSRRKLASNWDRYEASERQEPDDDTPAQRGTDYQVLLESAGDCFTQFRFSEEKEWEMDSSGCQMSAVFVDLPALAETLEQVPLHQRLNLEAELLQISTPLELPSLTLTVKQEVAKTATFTLPSAALKIVSSSDPAEPPVDDGDEELDLLLGLQKPVCDDSGSQSVSVAEERAVPKRVCEQVPVLTEEKMDEVKNKDVNPPESASVRQEMTEEDLEDWLDSMIS